MDKKKKKHLIGMAIAIGIFLTCGGIGLLTGVFTELKEIPETIRFDPAAILKIVLVIAFLYAINAIIQLLLSLIKKGASRKLTLANVASSLVRYAVVIAGFCIVLSILGVNVSTIFASLGIVALVLGFGAESLISDVVTGIFILFENQFNIGDIIEIDGFRGVVDSIGIRTISLRDTGGNIKIINNSDLSNIINRSAQGSVAICEVGVSYATDLDLLEEKIDGLLAEIKEKRSDVFIGEIKYLGVDQLGDSSVVLKIKADVAEKDIFLGKRVLNKEVKCAFDRAGFEIAFPQLDVHQK